jgi:hypothetical protein
MPREANLPIFGPFPILPFTANSPGQLSSRFFLRITKYFENFADNNFVAVRFGRSLLFNRIQTLSSAA